MKNENNKQKKTEIQENLEEQFQKLGSEEKAPEGLKKEVFNTLDTLQLLGDFADLFTAKFTETEATVIDIVSDPDEEGKKPKKQQ